MGGDRPGRRAARGRGRLSLLRFLGLDAEPADIAVPAPAGDVVTRLFSASAERPAGPGVAERTRWGSDGYRLTLPYVGRGMSAYVRVVDAPGGSRVVGEVRPSRWTQALVPLWVLVMVVRFVPGGGVERLLFGLGGIVLVGVVMHGSGNRVAVVRDWLERTVRG